MDRVTEFGHESIKAGSKSFALASKVLPPKLRDDASMLYAWCRYCDDIIDGQEMGHGFIEDYKIGQGKRLQNLREETDAALSGVPTNNPIFIGLARVFETHEINPRYAFELLDGFEMDTTDRVYRNVNDILDYSYHVAGVVGVMMATIMGVRDPEVLDRASDLGIAFQLTNIARDVIDDALTGRVFIPQDLLSKNGAPLSALSIATPDNRPAVHRAAIEQLDIAEKYYVSAKVGIKALPFRCAWAISAALSVYRDIGQILRRKGPSAWDGRVGASKTRKTVLALGALGPTLTRKVIEETSRDTFYTRPHLIDF